MTLLFIGGVWDGQRHEIGDWNHWRVAKPHPLGMRFPDSGANGAYETIIQTDEYEKVQLSHCGFVMVLRGSGHGDIIGLLVANYRPGTALNADILGMGSQLEMTEGSRKAFVRHLRDGGDNKATIILRPPDRTP